MSFKRRAELCALHKVPLRMKITHLLRGHPAATFGLRRVAQRQRAAVAQNSATSAAKRFGLEAAIDVMARVEPLHSFILPDAAKPRAAYILPARRRAAPERRLLNWQLEASRTPC